MNNRQLEQVIAAHGYTVKQLLPPQKGYRNTSQPVVCSDGQTRNLILYKQEPGIRRRIQGADAVATFLHDRGFPVRYPLGRIVRLQSSRSVRYARLYNYLDGETIPWEAYSQQHLKLLGKTLSDMHAALAEPTLQPKVVPVGSQPSDLSAAADCLRLLQRMRRYFASNGVRTAMQAKLDLHLQSAVFRKFEELVMLSRRLPGSQALHMDFVRGNVLFTTIPTGGAPIISGILDFEKTAFGPPVYDIARSLAFLLVDCTYKPADKVVKYFVRSGYQKRGGASLSRQALRFVRPLSRFYMLYDFYKFLLHNPYESLAQNQHFLRTRDFLLKDGIISR